MQLYNVSPIISLGYFSGFENLYSPIMVDNNSVLCLQCISKNPKGSSEISLFGHIFRADPSQDHQRAVRAAINRLPADWQHPRGRPRWTWLCTVELDLQPHNLGLNSAWKRAQDRSKWRQLVETAMKGAPPDDDDGDDDDRIRPNLTQCDIGPYQPVPCDISIRSAVWSYIHSCGQPTTNNGAAISITCN